ncbi:MAG: hypothetical protein KJ645_09915, partial [Planctomycetes bacterium]|nr:hypothetical protein [Planctomycetota bacterium]
ESLMRLATASLTASRYEEYEISGLNVPPLRCWAGIKMTYAYCLGNPFNFVSNPVEIEIVE